MEERESGASDVEQPLKLKQLQASGANIISHLTSEIESKSTNIMNFRSKISFTLFIGPFVLLGSIIVGTQGMVKLNQDSEFDVWMAFLAVAAFLTLGWLAGTIELQVWKRINEWRQCIVSLQDEPEITREQLRGLLIDDTIKHVRWLYVLSFFIILLAFCASAYVAASVLEGSVSNAGVN